MVSPQDFIVELTNQPGRPAPSVVVSSRRRHSGHVGRWRTRAGARMGAEGLEGVQRLKPNPSGPFVRFSASSAKTSRTICSTSGSSLSLDDPGTRFDFPP
jgi:hypothetical protein